MLYISKMTNSQLMLLM